MWQIQHEVVQIREIQSQTKQSKNVSVAKVLFGKENYIPKVIELLVSN